MEVMERSTMAGSSVIDGDTAWKLGKIMLRFRPIAPKPSAAGAVPASTVASPEPASTGARSKRCRGGKRQAGAGAVARAGTRGRKPKKLAPGRPEKRVSTVPDIPPEMVAREARNLEKSDGRGVAAVVVAPRPLRAVVTVESVAEAWEEAKEGLRGCAGAEIRRRLDSDDSPAFVSDAGGQVTWTNAAYRRMVLDGKDLYSSSSTSPSSSSSCWPPAAAEAEELRVVLVTRGLVPGGTCEAFTCVASVRFSCRGGRKLSLAVPCDVCRLASGGLAWRLDLKAALSLGCGS